MKRVNLLWKKRTATRNEVINKRGCFWITPDPFSTINCINKVFMLQTIRCCCHTHEFQMRPVIHIFKMALHDHDHVQWQLNRRSSHWVSIWGILGFLTIHTLRSSKESIKALSFNPIMMRLNDVFVEAKVVECYLSIKFLWGWVNSHNGRFDILTNFSRAGSNISPQPLIIPGFLVSNFPRHSQVNIRSSLQAYIYKCKSIQNKPKNWSK